MSKLLKIIKDYTGKLKGGRADNKNPKDFNQKQLLKGMEVEFEHTDDPSIAIEIAMDHLMEDNEYYIKLAKMENSEVKKVKNALVLPQVYYGLHMVEGVAHYMPPGEEEYTIFVGEKAIKEMNGSFVGRPVYVNHVDDVDLENIQEEADGYVVEAFFNKYDGKNWVKFIVVSDEGHEAILNGWRLSNTYIVKGYGVGGKWHGVEYSKEVIEAEYEHLAIVQKPRYDESIILSPDEFQKYNQERKEDIERLENSIEPKINKGEKTVSKFNLFKRTKVENQADLNLEELMVVLPNSKKEVSFDKMVNMADKYDKEMNGDSTVEVGDEKMTVNELKEKYMSMCKKKNEEDEDEKKKNEEDKAELMKNMSDEDKEKCKNMDTEGVASFMKKNEEDAEKEKEDKTKNSLENFDKINNAEKNAQIKTKTVDLSTDKLQRGVDRYGS